MSCHGLIFEKISCPIYLIKYTKNKNFLYWIYLEYQMYKIWKKTNARVTSTGVKKPS